LAVTGASSEGSGCAKVLCVISAGFNTSASIASGRVQRVGHERFGDLVTAARVVIGAAGLGNNRHRRRIRKRPAIKFT